MRGKKGRGRVPYERSKDLAFTDLRHTSAALNFDPAKEANVNQIRKQFKSRKHQRVEHGLCIVRYIPSDDHIRKLAFYLACHGQPPASGLPNSLALP